MQDLIDRQAAIDFIDAGHLCNPNEPRWSDNEVVNFLKSRPPAQPEPPEPEELDFVQPIKRLVCSWKLDKLNAEGRK